MIANLGYTPGQLAKEYGFKVSDLINPGNWEGDILTIGGIKYRLSFNYSFNLFEAIS